MNKKIEIWILFLFVLLSFPLTVFFGILVRDGMLGEKRFGPFSKTALFLSEIPANIKKAIKQSSDVQVIDRFPLLSGFNGTPNTNQSYLILSRYDGDLKEGIVELVDLKNFNILHTWNPDINQFFKSLEKIDEFKYVHRDHNNSRTTLSNPNLTKDGGLVFNSSPLMKIDSCSNLVFQNTKDRFHHSIEIDIEENIWVPSYIYPQSLPVEKVGRDLIEDGGYYDDAIVKLSPDGEIIFRKSVSQIFIDNGLEYLLFAIGDRNFTKDPIHLNDIQPVNFDGEFWKKGDVFLSLRHQSMILLYRPSNDKVIWIGTGPFFHQHDVDILNDHTISVFNNNSKDFVGGDVVDGHNTVVNFDFKTRQYSTYLNETLIKNDVRTITSGISQILPNGDLFVEETDHSRKLYFDADSSLRWSYVNRADDGNIYRVGNSRILYKNEDINKIENFLLSRGECND
ncbi:MAG: arylsulfotransferase family protein [Prochlorococcus marinus CUG1435]|nr:arylsulfotransferase family protein [Prochlorococcus marinus CUG1435]